MGTWSHQIFGNDSACDWAAALAAGDSLQPIVAAIDAVVRAADGVLDADAAVEALAAAEAIARMRGHPGERSAYTEALDGWVQRTRLAPPASLVAAARAALERIGGADSELRASWCESEHGEAWLATLADLRERLDRPPQAPQAAQAPQAPAESPPPADAVAQLLEQVSTLCFELAPLPETATLGAWYQRAVGAAALGDLAAVREAIQRLWQPVAGLGKPSIAFDLAVREAQAQAMEGRLDEALAGLEVWRGDPAAGGPGMFAMRAAGVCQAGGDVQRTQAWRQAALAEAPAQPLWRLDAPLYAARAGPAREARAQLRELGDLGGDTNIRLMVDFVEGVLACRAGEPQALALLTPVADDFAGKARNDAVVWSLASAAIGWWALALAQAGRRDDARAVTGTLRPVLLQPHNELLIGLLQEAAVLPAGSLAPQRPPQVGFDGAARVDHGGFRSIALRGVHAMKWIEAQRRRFAAGGEPYPFLIGNDEDLRRLLEMIAPPADGGRAVLDAAAAVDVQAWLKQHAPKRRLAWPRQAAGPHPTPLTLLQASTQRLKPVVHVGLVDLADPCELFARLGWGDWNACPAPPLHVALMRHWRERFGAEPVALSGDVVECVVARPPQAQDAALELARHQQAYCPDIVEQGTGTTARLGAALLAAPYWYFWWD